jgi:uncharacterized membrane protein
LDLGYLPNWAVLLHLLGLVMWVGGLLAVSLMLSRVGGLSKPEVDGVVSSAAAVERTLSLPGFLFALLAGLYLLLAADLSSKPMKQGWMHIKLTLVFLGLVPLQGVLGARRGKLRKGGDPAALAGGFRLLFLLTLLVAAGILFLIKFKPMNRYVP